MRPRLPVVKRSTCSASTPGQTQLSKQRRALRDARDTDHVPSWVAVPFCAVALAHGGDRDPLPAFLHHATARAATDTPRSAPTRLRAP